VLEGAGLVSRSRDAQNRPCHIDVRPLSQASEWLEFFPPFWKERLERLDAVLDQVKHGKSNKENQK